MKKHSDTEDEPKDRKHSLQPKPFQTINTRLTQSHNHDPRRKKTVKVPIEEERMKKLSVHSNTSKISKTSGGVDNATFELNEIKISRGNSGASSLRSSGRNPSIQSLEVVREQYCCYAKWKPCERALFAAVCVLAFIVLVLVVVVVLVALPGSDNDVKKVTQKILKMLDDDES